MLQKANLPKIEDQVTVKLEEPITEEEIVYALKNSVKGKSPGPDGFTTLYLQKFSSILIPRLCHYFNGLGADYEMSREALAATITVIKKEGKDNTLCSGFRPISLLNADTKLYAKILAERMKGIMTTMVHPNQVGFIPGREGKDNGVRALLLLRQIKDSEWVPRSTPVSGR